MIEACGYVGNQYGTGWQWLRTASKNNKFKLVETTRRGFVEIYFDNGKTKKIYNGGVSEDKSHPSSSETVLITRKDFSRDEIFTLAKQFAWEHNSDSLRDFIKSLV